MSAVTSDEPAARDEAGWAKDRWRFVLGPAITLATVLLILATRLVVPIASPGLLLLLAVAVSAVIGGIRPALISAAITAAFAVVDASEEGRLFTYTADSFSRLVVNVIVAPAMALLVGAIQARLEREETLAAGRRAEDRERAITETATDAIMTIDVESVIRAANPAAHELFGYRPGELVGRSLTELMPEPLRERHLRGFHAYLETGKRSISWQGIEITAVHRTGREFPVEVSFGEYSEGDGRRFTGIVRDIRRRRELEDQLRQAQKMEAVGQLAGGVAHDFNNVLTAVQGFSGLLREELPRDDPRQDYVRHIEEAASRATELVRGLLAFGRRQVLRPEVLDLNDVVRRVEPMLRRLIGEHIAMSTKLAADLESVEADRTQLDQVILNLAVNARDAMPKGGSLIIETAMADLDGAYAADHTGVTPGPHVMLAVSDTGIGIDAATREHIFEPFFTTKAPGEGTGLGLATVYGIVRQSGGHVWVYSEPGRGTTFKIYLPAVAAEARVPAPARPEPPPGRSQLVLVAEDEEAVRDFVQVALERLGYRVLTAATPAEAQAIGAEQPVEVLVTDVVMPGSSGVELAAALRVARPELRVLYMSGYAAGVIQRQGPLDDGDAYLPKPFTTQDLGRAVGEALGNGTAVDGTSRS